MASLVISKFGGIDRHSSDIDLPVEVARQLSNFSTTKKPGALSKAGSYADAASSVFGSTLPASITWKNFTEIPLTLPENRDIYILHGQDGSSNNHLYVAKYWDGSAFQSGFLKLTECEGKLTAGVGTNGSTIVCTGLSSSTNDYYNGWIVTLTNVAAGSNNIAAIVQDYVGSTKTLTFKTAAFGAGGLAAASGDTFYIARYTLIGDWTSGSPGGIANIDDIVRFAPRENAVIGMTGNASQYPTQYQLWYGYINREYGDGSPEQTFNNFWLDAQQMLKPYLVYTPPTNIRGVLEATIAAGGSLAAGTWTIYAAYEYDGFQIGPLSDGYGGVNTTTSGGNLALSITMAIPINGCWYPTSSRFIRAFDPLAVTPRYSPHLLSKRITGVYLFATAPNETDIKQLNTGGFVSINQLRIMSSDSADNHFEFDANENYVSFVGTTLQITSAPTGSTYLELVGQTGVRPNFKYGVALDDHFIVAGIRTEDGERKNNHLIASIVDGSGVATPDNFGGSNIINLGFYGSKEITGLKVIGDTPSTTSPKRRLLVATDDDAYIMTLQTGATFDFALDRIGNKEGIIAPDSIVSAEGAIFAISRNGFRMFTETGTQIIGEGLKDDFDALTDPAEAVGAYFKKYRQVIWLFPTDQKYYALDLLSKDLQMTELSFAHVLRMLVGSRTGDLYSMSTSAFYAHESGSTQAGTAFTSTWRSKKIVFSDFFDETTGFRGEHDKLFQPTDGLIRYRSDTAIDLSVYRNGGTQITFPNLSLPAQTTAQSRRFKFPMSVWMKDMEISITLTSSQASSNTYLELDAIKINAYGKARMD